MIYYTPINRKDTLICIHPRFDDASFTVYGAYEAECDEVAGMVEVLDDEMACIKLPAWHFVKASLYLDLMAEVARLEALTKTLQSQMAQL